MANPKDFKVGEFVSWNSSGGRARGKITKKVTDGPVPDIDVKVEGTPEDPAYQIRVYRDSEPTDTLVGHKGSALTKIQPIESKKAVDSDRLDEVYGKYRDAVNMSASELQRWSETECSRKASISRAPIKRNLELLKTKKAEWTNKHIRWANRTISFVSRMKNMPNGEPVSKECPSKRDISLKNWAYDPNKSSNKSVTSSDNSRRFVLDVSEYEFYKAFSNATDVTEKELTQIRELTNESTIADDWIIVKLNIANNLVNQNDRKLDVKLLTMIGANLVGENLVVDDDNFILSSSVVIDENSEGFSDHNKEIIEKEGLASLVLAIAVSRSSTLFKNIEDKVYKSVSFTISLYKPYLRCPNCEMSKLGDQVRVDTYYEDEHNNRTFSCPHLAASTPIQNIVGDAFHFNDYVILDSQDVDGVDLIVD